MLRSMLREFYPAALVAFGDDLTGRDALAVLAIAPNPLRGKALSRSKIASALRRAGRQRNIEATAEKIQTALRTDQLTALPAVAAAFGAHRHRPGRRSSPSSPGRSRPSQGELNAHFDQHPDADRSCARQPGLGPVLAARVLAEFGDDPHRYADARARRNYAATSPITRASGTRRVVLARHRGATDAYADALYLQAFSSADRLTRCPRLLRRTPRPRRHPPPSPARPGQPTCRHPPRLPAPPAALRPRTPPGRRSTKPNRPRRLDTLRPWDV